MECRIDRLGRIVIPSEMRKKIGLKARDEVFIDVVGEEIYLSKKPVTDCISRRLDDLCRLCIPMEIRSKLSIANNAKLDCVFEYDVIKLSRSKVCCVMCGGSESVKDVKMIRLCQECIEEIKVGNFWEAV